MMPKRKRPNKLGWTILAVTLILMVLYTYFKLNNWGYGTDFQKVIYTIAFVLLPLALFASLIVFLASMKLGLKNLPPTAPPITNDGCEEGS
jgi:hypothetical protein